MQRRIGCRDGARSRRTVRLGGSEWPRRAGSPRRPAVNHMPAQVIALRGAPDILTSGNLGEEGGRFRASGSFPIPGVRHGRRPRAVLLHHLARVRRPVRRVFPSPRTLDRETWPPVLPPARRKGGRAPAPRRPGIGVVAGAVARPESPDRARPPLSVPRTRAIGDRRRRGRAVAGTSDRPRPHDADRTRDGLRLGPPGLFGPSHPRPVLVRLQSALPHVCRAALRSPCASLLAGPTPMLAGCVGPAGRSPAPRPAPFASVRLSRRRGRTPISSGAHGPGAPSVPSG